MSDAETTRDQLAEQIHNAIPLGPSKLSQEVASIAADVALASMPDLTELSEIFEMHEAWLETADQSVNPDGVLAAFHGAVIRAARRLLSQKETP